MAHKYTITVQEIHDELGRMIADGAGGFPFAVDVGGCGLSPISGLGIGPVELHNGGACINRKEDYDGIAMAYVETPQMVPINFWRTHLDKETNVALEAGFRPSVAPGIPA